MWVAIALIIIPVISTTGCKRVARSSEMVDTATCVSAQEYKARAAQVYRCKLMLARGGYKDRTRIQACIQLGCSLEPPVGRAPGSFALSTTLMFISTTMTARSYGTMTTAMAMMAMAMLPTGTAMEMEQLGTRKDDTGEEEWKDKIQEVNASLAFNLEKLEETEKQMASLNKTLQQWTKRLNKTLHLDMLLMQKVEQLELELETGSGVDYTIADNATMDDAIMDNATIDAENTTMISWSDDEHSNVNERPGQENDILESKIISYLVLFLSATSFLTSMILLYKSREA